MAESNFRGVLGAEPLGEWGMAKTRAAEPRGKTFPLNFIRAEKKREILKLAGAVVVQKI